MIHTSLIAHYPGLLVPLLEALGFTNIKVEEGNERVQCQDSSGILALEIQHTTKDLPPASSMHIGIVSDSTPTRKKAAQAIHRLGFEPVIRHQKNPNESTLLGYVCIGRGRIGVEISTPKAHG